ncbi:PTS sugar transporter subunit IIC [Lactobacillus helveticus]|uniref:PTS sugar transporter subunit IIC n=1 Tax=Lactobacillus helveticus TaxID=1587 RepID=UPI0015625608|nr:PTS transporter subunit EIIC [Lactobacillus helveticus]NRO55412.1 Lichenan permease IIC component [Lactobacillus helveticus]
MKTITEWVEKSLVPKVGKLTNLRYFQALRNGFFAIMPLTIIGSIFILIANFPIPGYVDFMNGIFGKNWINYITPASLATFNMLGLVFAGTMSYKLAQTYDLDKLTAMVLGIVAYVVVIPKTVTTPKHEVVDQVMSFTWTGTQGVITAIIMAIIAVETMRFCVRKKLVIKMPDSVPPMVANAFSALIPGFLIVLISLILNGIGMNVAGSFPQMIYSAVQAPIQGIVGSSFAIIVVAGLNGLLWWFGIHPTVINSMLYPILYANADSNYALAKLGKLTAATGKFGTVQMLDQFATIGGAGCTIGLAITMLIVARSSRMKTMSKLSFIPAIFNINEPLIFGLPCIFNPMMLIPLTLAPIVSVLVTIISMRIGFMPMFTNVQVPWATPFIFSGFFTAGWQGAVTQAIDVALCTLIYYPFVKALDHQYLTEKENDKKNKK